MSHRKSLTEDYEFEVEKTIEGGYSVYLPHQCDSWEILGADLWRRWWTDEPRPEGITDDYPNLPTDKNFAVKQMELFVQRAQEALEKLKALS